MSSALTAEKVEHEEHERAARRSTLRSVGIVATCTCAMTLSVSDGITISVTPFFNTDILQVVATTTANIAFPTIDADLHIPESRLQWIASAFSLSSGCLLLLFGRLADLYGRRLAFLLGTLDLLAFSIGCALANDEITLDVLRGLQGCGAAATIPALRALI